MHIVAHYFGAADGYGYHCRLGELPVQNRNEFGELNYQAVPAACLQVYLGG
jgi:hypothetical protein